MTKEKIKIEGMSCNHCVMAVKRELTNAQITVEAVGIGFADIAYDDKTISREMVKQAIEEAGFHYQGEEPLN